MPARSTPDHYLRPNDRTRVPLRVIYLDTESSHVRDGDREEHRLRLWCATAIRRDLPDGDPRAEVHASGTTAGELVDWIEATVGRSLSWWLYCHNLNFDLALTALPLALCQRGWKLGRHALATDAPWARLSRGRASLTLADSWSWLPTSLAAIGEALGVEKPPLPGEEDSQGDWYARCRADVAILAAAMEWLIARWLAEDCGNWGVTGPASGWSYMRHICHGVRVLLAQAPEPRRFERAAISGGRRELTFKGRLPDRWYVNLDVEHAFVTICRDLPLPTRRGGHIPDAAAAGTDIGRWGHMMMADVLVAPAAGRYPFNTGQGWFYPKGRFWARLAGPQLVDAWQRGEVERVGEAYWYYLGAYMQPWAEAVIAAIEGQPEGPDLLWQLLCKGWSRTVPGRWAVRGGRTVLELPWPADHWEMESGWDGESDSPLRILSIPPVRQYIARDQEGDSSFPAVLAWIQSHLAVRLNALLDALGPGWLQCNTDGCIVDPLEAGIVSPGQLGPPEGQAALVQRAAECWIEAHAGAWAPLHVQVREVFRGGEMSSPQHIRAGQTPHMAGIPRGAKRLPQERYRFNMWGKLPAQIESHAGAGYTIRERTVDLSGVTTNRWHLEGGRCVTPTVWQAEAGGPATVGPVEDPTPGYRARLAPVQHPWLTRAAAGPAPTRKR